MSAKKRAVFSLYRSFRREIARLPTEYLRQFFRLKVGDDVRAILDTNHGRLQATKTKRVGKELRKLRDANAGRVKPFNYILDVAYGRIGKLRWEIMKPLLSDPKASLPDRIIPAREKSRPPVYSPELTALLTNGLSRTSKPLSLKALATPPKLPNRADPTSEEARLLGPFSKRRQVNIRWRYFTQEWKKLYPPLQVTLKEETSSDEVRWTTDKDSLLSCGAREVGLQDSGVFEEVEALAAAPSQEPNALPDQLHSPPPSFQSHLPSRFLRRRYQQLLRRLPVLTYSYRPPPGELPDTLPRRTGKYSVSVSPKAIDSEKRWNPVHLPEADVTNLAWLQSAELVDLKEEAARKEAKKQMRQLRLNTSDNVRKTNV